MKKAIFSLATLVLGGAAAAQTLHPLMKLEVPSPVSFAVVCDGGAKVVAILENNEIYAWSLPSGSRRTIQMPHGHLSEHAVACNDRALVLGSSRQVVVIDESGAEKQRVDIKDEVQAVAISGDGTLLVVAPTHSPLQLWELATGKRLWTGVADFGNSSSVAISNDGSLVVATDSDLHVRAYDRSGKLLYATDSGLLEPFDVSLSANGKKFAVVGAEGVIDLYESATGKRLSQSENAANVLWMVALSPGGTKALSIVIDDGFALDDTALAYWDTAGADLKKLPVDPKSIVGVGKFAQGFLLVSQEGPGKISLQTID